MSCKNWPIENYSKNLNCKSINEEKEKMYEIEETYCPFHGYNPPCERCMMAVWGIKNDKKYTACSFSYNASKGTALNFNCRVTKA